MPLPSITYHTRLRSDATVKVQSGSFGGALDYDTVNRMIKHKLFTVKALPSGALTFVDREGREVLLYMSIDPVKTEAGAVAMIEVRKAEAAAARLEEEKRERIEWLMNGMTDDEILQRLS